MKSLHEKHFDPAHPPVMLLGGLNVARALGLAGIPVIVAAARACETALASRYCSGGMKLPPLSERRAAVDALLHAGKRLTAALGKRVPLFYTNDECQRLVQDHRAELGEHYALLLNDAEVADAVIDKDRFQPLAARRGLPIPDSVAWESLEAFARPVLVKPHAKFASNVSLMHKRIFGRGGKARVFQDGRALLADSNVQQVRDQLLIQEYVEGDDRQIWSFHGFADEDGRLLAWFVGRKIRTYPVLTGTSSFLELAHDDEVAALGRQVVASLPLKGVFKIDLKRNARTGQLRVLEVNARYNLWHYLGTVNGVNLPSTAYRYLVYGERPTTEPRPRADYRWIYLRYDWRAYRQLAARGELRFAGWLASLVSKPFVCQLFSWRDPLPFFDRGWYWASTKLRRVSGTLRRWLSTVS